MKKEFKFGTDLDGKAKEELIRLAYEGKERSYAPYSGFQVGAALLAENGTVYLGCNIENAAYSATNCAERTAFFQAVSEGVKEFRAIAIVGGPKGSKKGELCAPCGVCRQVMMEFCDPRSFLVFCASSPEQYQAYTLAQLLPKLSLIHISEPTRPPSTSRMPSSA